MMIVAVLTAKFKRMKTTGKWQCREVINLLAEYGVKDVVLCPGTRDTPLIMAAVRHPRLNVHSVIDERSAGFIAYGMAKQSGLPVAVVCTSGSAAQNLTPAISEAYYAHIPVIAITADRPEEWIDQDDSQTIRQQNLMRDFTVSQVNISCHCHTQDVRSAVSRNLNVALTKGVKSMLGPVHINVEIDEPISEEVDLPDAEALSCRKIEIHDFSSLTFDDLDKIVNTLSETARIMIVSGFDTSLSAEDKKIISEFARKENVALIAENISNISAPEAITMVDEAMVAVRTNKQAYFPDIVITFGGALVSRALKEFLRESGAKHWMVGHHQTYPDCFSSLTDVYPEASVFLNALKDVKPCHSDYAKKWHLIAEQNKLIRRELMTDFPWCDLNAINIICSSIPTGWNLHLSNGMAVRYAMGTESINAEKIFVNRGVSGIDGSLSTAVGAASVSEHPTLLISGDMSAQYDMGALASTLIDSRLRIVVLMNGGGEIFRFIRTTRSVPELDGFIAAKANFPARHLAEAFGFKFLEANGREELDKALPELFGPSKKPIMLAVYTDGQESARLFHEYFKPFKTKS